MELQSARALRETVDEVVERWTGELHEALPGAEVVHIGGTSVPGALTRGDVDLHLRVKPSDFTRSCAILEQRFTSYGREMWTAEFAAFAVTEERRLPTGIALTTVGGEHDRRFRRGWELLRSNPELLAEYNALKREFVGAHDEDGYRAAKSAFFTRLEKAT